MADSLGSLVVLLSAETAQFTAALTKAEYQMRQSMNRMSAAVGTLEKAFGALFGIAAGAGFADMLKSAIDAEAELGILGARAGLTGEQMSSLDKAARLSHTSLDQMATFSLKLSKALLLAQDSTTKSALVLRALGITGTDVARMLKDPAQALLFLSKKLDMLPEGGTKAAAQMLLVGSRGGEVSAAMKELAKQTDLVAIRTNAEVAAAKAFEDRLVEMGIKSDNLKTALGNALLSTLDDVLDAFAKMATGAGGAQSKIDALAADGSIKEWARSTVLALGTVAETLIFLGRTANSVVGSFRAVAADIDVAMAASNAPKGKLTGSLGFSKQEADTANAALDAALARRNAILASANKNYQDLWNANGTFITDALKKQFALSDAAAKAQADLPQNADYNDRRNAAANVQAAAARAAAQAAAEKRVRDSITTGSRGSQDDPAHAALEAQIARLNALTQQEKSILTARDAYLKIYYAQGYISEKEYYDKRTQVLTDSMNADVATYTQELALIDKYIAGLGKRKGAEKLTEEAMKQRFETEQKLAKVQIEGATAIGLFSLESQEAARQYQSTLHQIDAELLAIRGHTAQAAEILRADSEFLQRRKLATSGDTGAIANLDELDRQRHAQDLLTESTAHYSLVVQELGLKQSAVDLAFQAGNITELQAYAQKADAARKMIPLLSSIADEYERIAKASGDPKFALAAQQMRLEIAKLGVDADALAQKFTNIFEGSFSTFLTDIVNHTKSVKQAFLDLAKSIEQQISKIAADNLAQQLFGKGGLFGGVGGFFAKMFGDKGAGSSTADASLEKLSSTTILADTSIQTMMTAAYGAAAALDAVSASGGGGALGSLLGGFQGTGDIGGSLFGGAGDLFGFPGFASGTSFAPGGLALVGERGPEIVNLPGGSQVIPNNVVKGNFGGKSGTNFQQTVSITIAGSTDTRSASQIALEVARQTRAALAKHG